MLTGTRYSLFYTGKPFAIVGWKNILLLHTLTPIFAKCPRTFFSIFTTSFSSPGYRVSRFHAAIPFFLIIA
jgi:hypothetical protein